MTKSITSVIRVLALRGLGVLISLGTAVGIAFHFGAGPLSDAFFLVRRIFGSIALLVETLCGTILVPGLVRAARAYDTPTYFAAQRRREMAFFAVGAALGVCVALAAPQIVSWIAPGLSPETAQAAEAFLMIMALTLPITFSTACISASLTAIRHFSMPVAVRLAPRVLILAAILLVPLGMGMTGIVIAAVLGHVVMFAALWFVRRRIAALSSAVSHAPATTEALPRETSSRAIAAIVIAVYSLAVILSESYAASLVGVGALAILALGQRISTLGVSEMLASVLSVYYTNFSERAHDSKALNTEVGNALRTGYFFTAPLTLCLAVLAPSIAQIVLANGAFTSEAARQAGALVSWFAFAALINTGMSIFETAILARAEPQKVLHFVLACSAAIAVRIGALILLVPDMGLNAIGLAAVLGPITVFAFHFSYLTRKIGGLLHRPLLRDLGKVFLAAGTTAALCYGVQLLWPFGEGKVAQIGMLATVICSAVLCYLTLAFKLGLKDAQDIITPVSGKLRRG